MYYASYIFRFILQGACREILCSPGKIYVDGDCSSSFLSQTSEILYGLAAKISFKNVASPDRIYLSDLIFELENIILNPHAPFFYLYKLSSIIVVNVPCTLDKSLKPIVEFEMFLHIIIQEQFVSREYADRQFVEYLGNRTQSTISFGNFKAKLIIENDWRSIHLPQLINLIFPAYYCKFISPYKVTPCSHVFMVDKFLLCPQITLNQTEYRILPESNRLRLLNSRQLNAYIDYTVGLDGDVKVCIAEYDAVMTATSEGLEISPGAFITITFVVILFKWSNILLLVFGYIKPYNMRIENQVIFYFFI